VLSSHWRSKHAKQTLVNQMHRAAGGLASMLSSHWSSKCAKQPLVHKCIELLVVWEAQ